MFVRVCVLRKVCLILFRRLSVLLKASKGLSSHKMCKEMMKMHQKLTGRLIQKHNHVRGVRACRNRIVTINILILNRRVPEV